MNSLDNRLRSWQPRRPSAGHKRRLFGNPLPKLRWVLGSLAPATACALLTLSILNSRNEISGGAPGPMLAMVLSNETYAAYASGNFREGQNNLASVTFDWTKHGSLTSSIAPFSKKSLNY